MIFDPRYYQTDAHDAAIYLYRNNDIIALHLPGGGKAFSKPGASFY